MMHKFEIRNAEREDLGVLGYLYYDEEKDVYKTEVLPDTIIGELPAILYLWANKGEYILEGKEALRFVRARVIPPDRQNIGEIMRKVGMKYYSEFPLLQYTSGRCCQDECYLVEV